MKNNYILLVLFLLFSGFMSAQSTEAFGEGTVSTAGPNSNGTVFNTSSSETHALKYSGSAANNGNFGPNFTLTNFTTCQTSVTLAAHGSNWAGYTTVRYAIEVNGNTIASNLNGDYNVDLTPYIPVTSVKLRSDSFTSFWLAMHATVTINSPAASMPTTVPTVTNAVICASSLPYTVQASLTEGGTTLKWYSDENGSNLSTGTKVVTTAGNHTLWVSQANASGCEGVRVPVTINVIDVNATTVVTNSHCMTPNGSIIVTPTTGTAPYTYLWQDGVTTKDRTNITFGDYSVTITDSNNCSKVINATVGMTTDMVVTEVSKTNVICYGDNTGALTIDVTGGTAPYTYQWPSNVVNGAGTNSISGLTAGNYNVVVTDANGCITNATFSLTQNAVITGHVSSGDYNCFLSENSITELEVYGGSGDYTYSWAPYGGTGKTATGLEPGIYYVTVTDSNGCEGIIEAYIENANLAGTVTTSQTNVSCNGGSNGTATITINSPEETFYEYNWYPSGGNEATATGLSAGEYTVTVIDYMYYCQITHKFTITEPAEMVTAITVDTPLLSIEAANGVLTATPTNGVAPFTYLWNTTATTATISGLSAGTYSCYITDANGCTSLATFEFEYIEPVLPIEFEVTGGGELICGDTVGLPIGLSGSEIGVNYQLYYNFSDVIATLEGTGSALSFGNFTDLGFYTVVAINASNPDIDNGMISNVMITGTNYWIEIETPDPITCMDESVTLTATVTNYNDTSIYGFEGQFAPQFWEYVNDNSNGIVDASSAPDAITITGGNNGIGDFGSGNTSMSIVVPVSGTLSFDWNYSTNDGHPSYDYPQISYNGLTSVLYGFDQVVNQLVQSGSVSMAVEAGDTLTFSMHTTDNGSGAASVIISNLFLDTTFVPALSWTATNGGVIQGATNELSVVALTSGTYTLTVTDGECTFSNEMILDFTTGMDAVTYWDGNSWSNGFPTLSSKAIIGGDLVVQPEEPLIVCELEITADGSLTIQEGATLGVVGKITNNATVNDFVIENQGSLIQLKNVQNEGPVTVNVNSYPLYRQDYTLWGSPVEQQNLRAFSPQTLYNRFSSYNTALGTNGDYQQEIFTTQDVQTKKFETGKGYLIRTPNNWIEYVNADTPGISYPGVFKGVPENGTITVPLSTANTGLNLVSNPYPSSIHIFELFFNNPLIEQTIYYWRKRNGVAGSGYATFNNMGFVSAQPDLENETFEINNMPHLSVGQGFFVKSMGATELNFNNNLRRFETNGVFLKAPTTEKHRFRLNLSKDSATIGQTLIGYTAGATSGKDNGFDSNYFNDSPTALTSLINGEEFIIQGLGLPFDNTSTVSLGFKTSTAGTYTISLSNFDGLFAENQAIYIKDNVTGIIHNVKESGYSFTANEGIANDRFEVVYQSTLGTDNPSLLVENILVAVKDKNITINAGTVEMTKIELIDLAGRVIYTQEDVNATTARIEGLSSSDQMLVVRITTSENGIVNKKIIY